MNVATIRKVPGKQLWYIVGEPGKKYKSYGAAKKRLDQIEMFKHMKGKKRKSSDTIALRVACGQYCPVCGMPTQYDDATDSFVCRCGYVGPNAPAAPATVIAGADIYERFNELTQAIGVAECDESEEAAHLRELDELLRKRDETLEAIKAGDKEKKSSAAASKAKLSDALQRAAAANPRLASILGKTTEMNMRPTDMAAELRAIAAKIDASHEPSRQLVASDIRRVIAAMEREAAIPGLEKLDENALLKLSQKMLTAIQAKSAGDLLPLLMEMDAMMGSDAVKEALFKARAEKQKGQLYKGTPRGNA